MKLVEVAKNWPAGTTDRSNINEEWYDVYRDYKGMGYSDAQARAEADRAYPQPKAQPKQKANEGKKSPAGGPPCWKGKKIHPTKPTKMKGGKRVNNCIDAGTNEEVELDEGPLVLSNDSSLLRMLDTLLSDWKSKQHSDDEMAALLKALGYSMDKKGDRTVLVKENELEEAPGAIRKGLAAVALIAGLWGVNNQMAQQAYDASPQLQKLTAYLEVAKEHNDQRMIKQLEQRIENHKARIDIGKGEVMGKDGKPADVVYDKKRGREI